MLRERKILLAVTGGIAAYKACELARLMIKNRACVQVLMTQAATHFVNPLTFKAITGRDVALELFGDEEVGQGHLDLVRDLDLMVIAPATANCLGKLAHGIADDLMCTAVLALSCPLLICPAMNPTMFAHPAVRQNLEIMRQRGALILGPEEGAMAHPLERAGWGRLPEPETILDRICELLPPTGPLSGLSITVTAGPTREAIDPVRMISNFSSGKMGYALAEEAYKRGASVRLISGPVALAKPPGIPVDFVENTEAMRQAVLRHYDKSHIVIMAAAPADFRVGQVSPHKIKKKAGETKLHLELERTPDILMELGTSKGRRLLVGFALETEEGIANARQKLQEKNLDLIVLNHPAPTDNTGLGKEMIQGTLIDARGNETSLPAMPKSELAAEILNSVQQLLVDKDPRLPSA